MSQPSQTSPQPARPSVPAIGFYSVEYSEHLGWIGGYLMLNAGGRPLEFHCTLPIRPSRTQEILYGATLRDQLIGEAIPTALLKQSKNQPLIFCSDQPEALRFADRADFPVVLAANELNSSKLHVPTITIQTAQGTLRTEARFADRVRDAMETLAELPDIEEPFARIREAIREAQQQAPARAA